MSAESLSAESISQIGPYRVIRFIAEGGFAWVYEVADPKFERRRLALKMLKPHAAHGDEFRRFEAEARLISSFDHPNLVTVFDFGEAQDLGCFYYTMNFIDGEVLSRTGALSPADAAPIFVGVLSGLIQLHNAGIVHRDIKPQNVLMTRDGRAMLADLGIAREMRSDQHLTETGHAVGTARYMSPEQARGLLVEPPSDTFAMGLLLYEVLTGRSVYEDCRGVDHRNGQEILAYLGSLFHSGKELDFRFEKRVPRRLRDVVRKACALANGTGRTGTLSGNPPSGCGGGCHGTGATADLNVSISGPSTLLQNQTGTYTLAIAEGGTGGAFNLAITSGAGTLSESAGNVQLLGIPAELTHVNAFAAFDAVPAGNQGQWTYNFNVTAPSTIGATTTLAAAGMRFFSLGGLANDPWNLAAPFTITVVPEPTTAALLGLGLVGLAVCRNRRN